MKNINDAVTSIRAEITRLQGVLSHLEGDAAAAVTSGTNAVIKSVRKALLIKPAKTEKSPVVKKARRTRRTSADVKAQAAEMAAFIKGKGKEGVTGKEITAKFGPVLPSIKLFINDRVDSASKIRTRGASSRTTYHAV